MKNDKKNSKWMSGPAGRGYTIIELLIVVGLIAFIAVIGTVAYYTQTNKIKDERAKSNLKTIYTQERIYYFDGGSYTNQLGNLDLDLADTAFTYSINAFSTGFTAQAVKTDGSKTFTIDETGEISE